MSFARRNIGYVVLALTISALVLSIAVLLPNTTLLTVAWMSGSMTMVEKLLLTTSLLDSLTTNFSLLTIVTMVSTALLVGVNVALVSYFYRRQERFVTQRSIATTSVGTFLGMFSVGCAACGSLILMSVSGVIGGVGILTFLPLHGQEVGILGTLILGYTTFILVQKLIRPLACDIS